MAQTEITELLIRVRNLEERVQNLTHENQLLTQQVQNLEGQVQTLTLQRDAALNMAERAVLYACDVLSANSNVSGWQVKNEMHAIINDIESLRRSFTLQESWKNHQSTGHSNGADSHEMLDTLRSSNGTATHLHTRNELGSQRADPLDPDGLKKKEKEKEKDAEGEIEKRLLQEPIAEGLRNSLIKFYMTVGLSTA